MSRQRHDPGADAVLSRWRPHDARTIPRTHRLAQAWTASLRRRSGRALAEASSAALARGIRAWLRHLAAEACTDAPDAATVQGFADRLAATHRSATVALYLAAVRGLYRWAAARGLADDIAAGVRGGGGADADPPLPPLDDAAFARAVRAIAGDDLRSLRDRALLACLRSAPVESIAWARARIADADLDAGRVLLMPRARARDRVAARRQPFALNAMAALLLHEYLSARGETRPRAPLFASLRGDGALSTLSMRLTVLRCLEASGLRPRSPGVARNRLMLRYPVVAAGDLAHAVLPGDADGRARTRALLALLAMPRARVAWERLRWDDLDLAGGSLAVRRGGRSGTRTATIALPRGTLAALRTWLRRCGGDGPLFADAEGAPLGHHALKRLAWAAFPQRLPAGPGRGPAGSTRRIAPARTPSAR